MTALQAWCLETTCSHPGVVAGGNWPSGSADRHLKTVSGWQLYLARIPLNPLDDCRGGKDKLYLVCSDCSFKKILNNMICPKE